MLNVRLEITYLSSALCNFILSSTIVRILDALLLYACSSVVLFPHVPTWYQWTDTQICLPISFHFLCIYVPVLAFILPNSDIHTPPFTLRLDIKLVKKGRHDQILKVILCRSIKPKEYYTYSYLNLINYPFSNVI